MKKLFFLSLACLAVLPGFVLASEFGRGPTVTLPSSKIVAGNYYATGGTLNILGSASKDIIALGGNILISGTTSADLMVAGGSITVVAPVGSDARLAGGNISLSAPIGGELLAASGNLSIDSSTIVGGDAYLAGDQVVIDGSILGKAEIAGQQVTINGTIGKNVTVRAQKIVIGPQANIIGDFSYQSSEKAQIASSARIAGKTTFSRISGPERYSWGNTLALLGLAWLLKLIAFAVAVLALFFLLPRRMMQLTEAGTNAFWRELVRGFVVLVVWPVALFILFFSVVGWVLALIGLFAYLFLLFASAIVTVFITAGLLQKYAFKGSAGSIDWPKLLLATVVLFLIGLIPVVGWFIVLAIYLSAIGVTARLGYDLARR